MFSEVEFNNVSYFVTNSDRGLLRSKVLMLFLGLEIWNAASVCVVRAFADPLVLYGISVGIIEDTNRFCP
jgi:hypothetical protein